MSVFHQLKNIFSSSNHHTTYDDKQQRHHSNNSCSNSNKSKKYEAAVTKIVKEESIAKSKVPVYDGLDSRYNLTKKLGEYVY